MLEKNGYTNKSKEENNANPIVIGLTGSFGSGCTFIGQEFLRDKKKFQYFSLSIVLKKMFRDENGRPHNNREELQLYGNKLRKINKKKYYLAEKIYEELKKKKGGRISKKEI